MESFLRQTKRLTGLVLSLPFILCCGPQDADIIALTVTEIPLDAMLLETHIYFDKRTTSSPVPPISLWKYRKSGATSLALTLMYQIPHEWFGDLEIDYFAMRYNCVLFLGSVRYGISQPESDIRQRRYNAIGVEIDTNTRLRLSRNPVSCEQQRPVPGR